MRKRSHSESHSNLGWQRTSSRTTSTFVTLLEYVAQFQPVPDGVLVRELSSLRRLAPGPGNWITKNDLENIASLGLPADVRTIALTARAAKLRIHATVAPDAHAKYASLLDTQTESLRRPFGSWHSNNFFAMISQEVTLSKKTRNHHSLDREMR